MDREFEEFDRDRNQIVGVEKWHDRRWQVGGGVMRHRDRNEGMRENIAVGGLREAHHAVVNQGGSMGCG